ALQKAPPDRSLAKQNHYCKNYYYKKEMNMLNEKQNNLHHWINKLDEPGYLPAEEMVDKNEAWKKLHQRLSGKPRKNKMIWYWAAAACLIISFSLPMILA